MKYLFLILIILQFNCRKAVIREFKPSVNLNNPNLKIGLVGFYPYDIKSSKNYGRRRTATIGINYEKPLKNEFGIGKDLSNYQKPGTSSKIDSEKVASLKNCI